MEQKKIVRGLFFALLILTQVTYSQIKIGAKVGYSLGRIADNSDNIYTEDYENTDGVDFGATVEFPISELFSVQTEVLFTQRGGERFGLQPIPSDLLLDALEENNIPAEFLNVIMLANGRGPVTNEDPLYADFDNISELQYLEIPVLAKFGWGTDWRFYVEGGPYVGFLLSANQVTSGETFFYTDSSGNQVVQIPNPIYNPEDPTTGPPFLGPIPEQDFTATTDVKDDLNDVLFGIHAGAGLIRKLNEHHELYLGFRGSYSFTTLQKDSTFGESHIGGLVFSLGYAYTL